MRGQWHGNCSYNRQEHWSVTTPGFMAELGGRLKRALYAPGGLEGIINRCNELMTKSALHEYNGR